MKRSMLYALCSMLLLAACAGRQEMPYNATDFQNGGPDAPLLNERTMQFMNSNNQFVNADTLKPVTTQQKTEMNDKWDTSQKETRWQEYRGTMVRVEILLGSTDARDMRLKIIQNANGTDVNGDNREVLSNVSDFEMKRVCGRNAASYVVIYDKPSFEVLRPTPFFDYLSQQQGSTMREYGFRCIFNN